MRFNLPRLIGITGKAGAGKDTLADYLVRQHGFIKYSLAGPLKQLLADHYGFSVKCLEDREFKEREASRFGIKPDGSCFSIREHMQWLGTEVGRHIGGADVWINLMEQQWRTGVELGHFTRGDVGMVVPDVRFDNEAARIITLGGTIIRVTRPGQSSVPAHVSENGVRNELVNVEVRNDSDIVTFLRNCVYALEQTQPRGRHG